MTTQMTICMIIFVVTLISYMVNRIPMWLTALLSMAALYAAGCIDADGALSGFANANTILMATMFVVAAGFRRTTMVDSMCNMLMKATGGSFKKAYFGYLLLAALLTNFIASPMVVYAIVSPLLGVLLDRTDNSRSRYMFPIMVVCVACCGILPLSTAIQQAGQFTGFMESYGFTGMKMEPIYFTIGAWPILIVTLLWALFLGPKSCPEQPIFPIEAKSKTGSQTQSQLSPMTDKIGIAIFFITILALVFSGKIGKPTWFIALLGSLLMVLFGVVDQKSALRDIPWDMLMLFVGALALGNALTNTGAGTMIGDFLANAVSGTRNNYVLGALFFLIPFILTQFMLNRAVSAVFVPICMLAASSLGANPIGLILLVNAGSLTAFLTPMATPAVPMCMADGGYDLKALVKGGALITLIIPFVYIFYTMTVFPAFK
ncbi:MAG: SLC13 family permease [Lachnospiraceae bacterium]